MTISDWGTLLIFDARDEVPGLRGSEPFWVGDEHRRPVLLQTRGESLPHVAVWPANEAPPANGELTESDLRRVVLAQPNASLKCFACGATLSGLYVDTGLPFFRAFEAHEWVGECPRCGAHADAARLHGVLAPVH